MKIDNCKCSIVNEMSQNPTVVHVRCQYHVHATDPDLHRMIAFMECDKNDKSKYDNFISLHLNTYLSL